MKNSDFPLLNDMCEEYFQYNGTTFIANNLIPLADLCKSLISLGEITQDAEAIINDRGLYAKTEVPPSLSISICEQFLEQIHPSLKYEFQKSLTNGTMNLVVVEEENKIKDTQRTFRGREENFADVNVGIYCNLTDPQV